MSIRSVVRVTIVLAATSAAFVIAGCGGRSELSTTTRHVTTMTLPDATALSDGSTTDATACTLVGTWQVTYTLGSYYLRFTNGGTFFEDSTRVGIDSASPEHTGTYTFANGRVTLADSVQCAPGTNAVYSLVFDMQCDRASGTMLSDTCNGGHVLDVPYTFTRVE